MMPALRSLARAGAVCAALFLLGGADARAAQAYPSRPIRLVVGYAPGGTTDLLARMLANGLSIQLHQPVIVDNRPGANGALAVKAVINSAPDGYTLLAVASGAVTVEPVIHKPATFDPVADLSPIGMIAQFPLVLLAGNDQPFSTLPQLIESARARPGTLSYASAGNGSLQNLWGEAFKQRMGLDIVHVPYKGDVASLADLAGGGNVSFSMYPAPVAEPLITAGKVKAIATLDAQRSALLPLVATSVEQGLEGYDLSSWIGVFGPKGLPKAIVEQLNAQMIAFGASPEATAQFSKSGLQPNRLSPAQLGEQIRRETARWKEVAEKAGIVVEQ